MRATQELSFGKPFKFGGPQEPLGAFSKLRNTSEGKGDAPRTGSAAFGERLGGIERRGFILGLGAVVPRPVSLGLRLARPHLSPTHL